MSDPTRIDLNIAGGGVDPDTDPLARRFRGIAVHGNTPFDAPFISHVTGNLYQGGCTNGLVLPEAIKHVVSLYPWEAYTVGPDVTVTEVKMYDSEAGTPDHGTVLELAQLVCRSAYDAPTLVHCQAGLNRSGLIAACALILDGWAPVEAIALLREKRSLAVLCNRSFERFVLNFRPLAGTDTP